MKELFLLGDSIIDNGLYVDAGEPDVFAQISEKVSANVTMRAVDGDVVEDAARRLDSSPLPDDAAVFLSIGGNDALNCIGFLGDPDEIRFVQAMTTLHGIREDFRGRYVRFLDRLRGHPVMVATIYNPNFTGGEQDIQVPAEAALSAFNDVIQQEALARGFAVLELRTLFTDYFDYANPIEPSAVGGAKIAQGVSDWIERL